MLHPWDMAPSGAPADISHCYHSVPPPKGQGGAKHLHSRHCLMLLMNQPTPVSRCKLINMLTIARDQKGTYFIAVIKEEKWGVRGIKGKMEAKKDG